MDLKGLFQPKLFYNAVRGKEQFTGISPGTRAAAGKVCQQLMPCPGAQAGSQAALGVRSGVRLNYSARRGRRALLACNREDYPSCTVGEMQSNPNTWIISAREMHGSYLALLPDNEIALV